MNKPYIWTEEKIEKLKQMYPVATWDEMFKYFQTDNKHVIMHKARQLKIDRTCYNSKYFTEEQGRFITENIYTMSAKEIGEHIGKTPKQVNAWAKRNGLNPIDGHRIIHAEDMESFKKNYPYMRNSELCKKIVPYLNPRQVTSMAAKLGLKKIPELSFAPPTNEQLLEELSKAFEVYGRCPTYDEMLLIGISPTQVYKARFGSMENACHLIGKEYVKYVTSFVKNGDIKAKVLDSFGNERSSVCEAIISDILLSNNIDFVYDKMYRKIFNIEEFGDCRFDWYINGKNKVIEYFGLDNKEQYKIKMKRKIALCEKYKINLLALYPKDIHCNNLEERILTFVKSE